MEAGKDAIHETGEGGRSVTQTKGDLIEFEQLPAACSKRGLRLVLFCDGHLPVPTLEIQSGEPFGPMEGVEDVIYPRQRVSILDGSRVKLAEVHTKAQATVFLPHHHHWRSPWAVRGADDIAGQHLLHLSHLLSAN